MRDENNGDTESKLTRDFDAFAIRQNREGKGHFHKIGAAFKHKDGEGYDIDLVAAPTNGRVTLRTPQERLEEARGGNQNGQKRSRDQSRGRD